MPSGWLKERALGGSSLGRGEDAWFCSPPRRPARRRHTPHAARRPTPAPCPSRSPARRARAALVPGSARPAPRAVPAPRARAAATRPVASHPRPAAQRSSPRTLRPSRPRRSSPSRPRRSSRPTALLAVRLLRPLAPRACLTDALESAQINSNFPYLVKKFLTGCVLRRILANCIFRRFTDSLEGGKTSWPKEKPLITAPFTGTVGALRKFPT